MIYEPIPIVQLIRLSTPSLPQSFFLGHIGSLNHFYHMKLRLAFSPLLPLPSISISMQNPKPWLLNLFFAIHIWLLSFFLIQITISNNNGWFPNFYGLSAGLDRYCSSGMHLLNYHNAHLLRFAFYPFWLYKIFRFLFICLSFFFVSSPTL